MPVVRVGDVARLGVERRQADGGEQHAHGVGVVPEASMKFRTFSWTNVQVISWPRCRTGPWSAARRGSGGRRPRGARLLGEPARSGSRGTPGSPLSPSMKVTVRQGGVDVAGVVDREAGGVLGGADLAEVGGLHSAVEDRCMSYSWPVRLSRTVRVSPDVAAFWVEAVAVLSVTSAPRWFRGPGTGTAREVLAGGRRTVVSHWSVLPNLCPKRPRSETGAALTLGRDRR